VDVQSPDGPVELPMSAVRNLAYDADRGVRRRAFEAELAAWQAASVPIAAALNSIKGEANTLSTRRGWASPLDQALSSNNIDHQTLDAMLAAMREAFPEFRRYLRAKARLLDLPVLAWYDLFAPVGGDGDVWPFEDAVAFVSEHFGAFSPRLSALARRASSESWIDAEPRPGKEDGAFCVDLRADESRVLLNYQPAFVHVSILAHELGHAYHNLNLAGRTMLQRATPMTLAETASIFCETIIRHAAFGGAGLQGQLAILETSLQNACVVVVDIASRFLFEQQVFERRRRRELSVDELCAMMRDAQLATYGDALDAGTLHPFMWAAKSHYYDATFYNYPYAFGLLFGLGLYAIYQRESEGFQERYDRLLASTGLGDAAQLAAEFGIDIQTPEFWRTSLGVITADIDRFEHLITALYQQPTM
jgi:oligoendopeptidase F